MSEQKNISFKNLNLLLNQDPHTQISVKDLSPLMSLENSNISLKDLMDLTKNKKANYKESMK